MRLPCVLNFCSLLAINRQVWWIWDDIQIISSLLPACSSLPSPQLFVFPSEAPFQGALTATSDAGAAGRAGQCLHCPKTLLLLLGLPSNSLACHQHQQQLDQRLKRTPLSYTHIWNKLLEELQEVQSLCTTPLSPPAAPSASSAHPWCLLWCRESSSWNYFFWRAGSHCFCTLHVL